MGVCQDSRCRRRVRTARLGLAITLGMALGSGLGPGPVPAAAQPPSVQQFVAQAWVVGPADLAFAPLA